MQERKETVPRTDENWCIAQDAEVCLAVSAQLLELNRQAYEELAR